jgi:hypothetical protein
VPEVMSAHGVAAATCTQAPPCEPFSGARLCRIQSARKHGARHNIAPFTVVPAACSHPSTNL